MTSNFPQGSAKIIAFPRRLSGHPVRPQTGEAMDVDARYIPAVGVDFGSGWYHQAAVQAERGKKS